MSSMSQFYVEIEGLWFDPKIKNIWESAFWIWHFYYQHRLVVSDLLLMTIKHFSRHWGTSAYYLGFQAPPLLPENPAPTYRSTSWSVDQLEFGHPGDGPVAHHPSNDPLHPRPRLRHQSGSGGDPVQSCSDHCIAWSLHLMYTYLIYHSPSIRGPRPMLLLWSVCLLVNIMQVDSKKWLTKRNISIF